MEVDGVGIIATLSMSYITTRIEKTSTSVAKIPRVPVENQVTTLSVVKIAIKFSPCGITESSSNISRYFQFSRKVSGPVFVRRKPHKSYIKSFSIQEIANAEKKVDK